MKTRLRRMASEWERSLLWASIGLFTLVMAGRLCSLVRIPPPSVRPVLPAPVRHAYLNESTAFAFQGPPPPSRSADRNPFAFSCRLPPPPQPAVSTGGPAEASTETAGKVDTRTATLLTLSTAGPPAPAGPVKRLASVLYRGLYRGGADSSRQLAFVSTQAPADTSPQPCVLAVGETTRGVVVKRITSAELVVAGPTGENISIKIGKRATIALD